jgi:hypothetical protein
MKRSHLIALAMTAAITASALSTAGCSTTSRDTPATTTSRSATASASSTTQPSHRAAYSPQVVLPFTGLEDPEGLAVDNAGNVYVADLHHFKDDNGFPDATTRVIELPTGSNTQTVLPQFVHAALVAGPAGAVWVVDARNEHLVKLAAGSDTQTVRPLPDLGFRGGVMAMDAAGNAYGINGGGVFPDGGCCVPLHVVKSEVGSPGLTVLPLDVLIGLGGMAVDAAGNVYVGDVSVGRDGDRVLKLAAGADPQTVLPFTHLHVADVAVDSAGNVYVVDAEQVLKLPAGADTPIVLPFTGIKHPTKVAVDAAGDVYVIDAGSHQILKLAAA